MNISRHNYEEFFILYMDNELAPAERRMVEDFVQLHPDLKEELNLLQQFKLTPDTDIVFTGKEELMKGQTENSLNLSNYTTSLLFYTDNELSAAEKTAVEQFAAENPVVKKELDLLLFTRVQPETISFPDKASLYREEEKVRALPVRWWRAAAAILILGLSVSTVLILRNRAADAGSIAGKPGKNSKMVPGPSIPDNQEQTAVIKQEQPVNPDKEPLKTPMAISPANNRDKKDMANADNRKPQPKQYIQQPVPDNTPVVAVNGNKDNPGTNNLPKPENNPNVKNNTGELAVNSTPKANNDPKDPLTTVQVTKENPSPSNYTTAAYTEGNDAKKNKLRGFFRKVTRTFEKRTNIDPTDEENRLLVGGLAIRLK